MTSAQRKRTVHDELRPIYKAGAVVGISAREMNLCELQEVASMLGVAEEDDLEVAAKAKALDVLAGRVNAAASGQSYEAPVGWGTQISAADIAAFSAVQPGVEPVIFGDPAALFSTASSPSELQPTD